MISERALCGPRDLGGRSGIIDTRWIDGGLEGEGGCPRRGWRPCSVPKALPRSGLKYKAGVTSSGALGDLGERLPAPSNIVGAAFSECLIGAGTPASGSLWLPGADDARGAPCRAFDTSLRNHGGLAA